MAEGSDEKYRPTVRTWWGARAGLGGTTEPSPPLLQGTVLPAAGTSGPQPESPPARVPQGGLESGADSV